MKLQKLLTNKDADIKMVGAVVALLVTLIVAVLIFYSIAGTVDTSGLDSSVGAARGKTGDALANHTDVANSTDDILSQSATFFSVAPIIAIVIVAVVILGYVSRIGG